MHCNIHTTGAQNLLLVHSDRATQWKRLWFNVLTSIDTKLDHDLENIYEIEGEFFHLLCIYSKSCMAGFII
jgi:hypothetical protein